MTAISPYARLVRLTDNAQIASTTSLVGFSLERVMDAAGARSITVPLGDAGAAIADAGSFARGALGATGGADATSAPVPTLCELSLDGGSTVDARFIIEQTAPDLSSSGAVLHISGHSPAVLYGASGPDRVPLKDVALADVLGGNPSSSAAGTIAPVSAAHYGISTSGVIPSLRGLLVGTPGDEPASGGGTLWHAAARARFAVTGVVSNALSGAIAGLGVNIDAWEDTTLRLLTSVVTLLGGVFFSGDSAEQGSRGHAVWCDSDVNLSGDIAGVVADGTPHASDTPAWHGTNGYSNDAANHPTGVKNALVIGNVGGDPRGVPFTFDGTSSLPLAPSAEASTARLQTDQTRLVPDLTPLVREVRLTGGTSDAGLPPGATLTAIVTLNNQPTGSPPYYDWRSVLPIIAANQGNGAGATGGLYVDVGDSTLRALPSYSLALPIYDIVVDNDSGTMYLGTEAGVWGHSTTDLATATTPWLPLGGLRHPIKRLTFVGAAAADPDPFAPPPPPAVLVALVSGVGKEADGIYQSAPAAPTGSGAGYDGWQRISSKERLIDAIATDANSFFFLDDADKGAALWYHDGTPPVPPRADWPLHSWSLGTGVQGTRLDRVLSAGGGSAAAQDTVWVSCSGGPQAAQYVMYFGDLINHDWYHQDLWPGDGDGSLAAAVQTITGVAVQPQVNRIVSLGYGINSVTVAVVLCTQVGLYYMDGNQLPNVNLSPPTGSPPLPSLDGHLTPWWHADMNGMNGLGGISLTHVVAGQQTSFPDPYNPAGHVQAARMYAIGGSTLYYSYSDGRYWRDRLRDPLGLAPIFFALSTSGSALPNWGIQTIGPMASSPIGAGSGSHVTVAGVLPDGWYLWRHYGAPTYEPYYGLVNGAIPWPNVYTEQVSDVSASPTMGLQAASEQLLTFAIVLLGEHSRTATSLTVVSTCSQQESGLLALWPTHQVAVSQSGAIPSVSEAGEYITTTYIDLVDAPFYVQSHTITGDGPLVTTTTTLVPSLKGAPKSGSDLAQALVQDQRRIRISHRNRGH